MWLMKRKKKKEEKVKILEEKNDQVKTRKEGRKEGGIKEGK